MLIAITGAQNDGRPPGATRWSSATAPSVDPARHRWGWKPEPVRRRLAPPDETEVESGSGTMRARAEPGPRSYPVRSGFARQNVYWSWVYRNWMSFDVPVSPMNGPAKK
jgi:hypothetical protein